MARLAFLGIGNMGAPMAGHLLRAGHEVAIYNRTPGRAEALRGQGAEVCDTPMEAASGASAILCMLSDDAASRLCWTGGTGILAADLEPDVLAIECSSLSRGWILELGELLAGRARLVDCPVAGRPDVAEMGQLKIFAGGSAEDVAQAESIVQAFSTKVTRFGPLGSGVSFKLIYNLLGASQIAALAEALAACERLEIDLAAAAHAISMGNTGSPHIVRHAAWMGKGTHPVPAQFSGNGRIKDLTYALALLREAGIASLSGEAALTDFERMRALGMSDQNDSIVFEALRARLEA